jgi:hypothetical protein
MPVDFDALVNKPALDIFGKTILYKPQDGDSFTLTVVFDEAWRTLEVKSPGRGGYSLPVSTTRPQFGCRAADFPAGKKPEQGDGCTIDGVEHAVSDAQPDGVSGWFLVSLN